MSLAPDRGLTLGLHAGSSRRASRGTRARSSSAGAAPLSRRRESVSNESQALELDELGASAGDRSEPVALLHRWEAVAQRSRRSAVLSWPAVKSSSSVGVARRRQAPAAAVWWRWSLTRLWVAVIRRHSDRHADMPRRKKRSMRRLNLVWAKTGSIVTWRLP